VQGIGGWDPFPIGVYPENHRVVVEIGHLQKRRPFIAGSLREELRRRLAEAVPSIDWSLKRKSHFPDVPLGTLAEGDTLNRFLDVIDWVLVCIRRTYGIG
jgi:hypothetical protein